jgi:hypothetical protein
MIFSGKMPECFFQIVLRRILFHAQDFIVIPFYHNVCGKGLFLIMDLKIGIHDIVTAFTTRLCAGEAG